MANLLDFGGVRVFTSNAAPGAGYVASFFESGTTTPVVVYTDGSLGSAHGTSITADTEGWFAEVWSAGGIQIKCVITTPTGAVYRTIDPVIAVSGASDATSIPFAPSIALPYTNVQDAIEGAVTAAATGFEAFGLGVTGTNADIANIDATGTGSGFYRFTASTTGTFPTGVTASNTGIVEILREDSGSARMWLYPDNSDRSFIRRMASSTWGAWREEIHSNQAPADGDILYRASGAWTRLAKGTALQILAMNSGATAPEYAPAPLGVGQTWQSPVRAMATTYQNTTGRPIQLCITVVGGGGGGSAELLIGATAGTVTKRAAASCANGFATPFPGVVIPSTWHYRVNAFSGSISIDTWAELFT